MSTFIRLTGELGNEFLANMDRAERIDRAVCDDEAPLGSWVIFAGGRERWVREPLEEITQRIRVAEAQRASTTGRQL